MVRLEISRFVLEAAARPYQSAVAPGGLYFRGYHIIGACSLIQFLFLGALFSYGVLFPTLEAEFGWSRTALSGASSASFLLMGALAIGMGKVNDIVGPRLLLSVTGALYGLGYLLLSQMESIWTLYLCFSLLVGIGMAAHDVGTLSTATRWFVTRRGMMTGVVKAGAGMGQLFIPLAVAALVAAYDWRTACLVIGATVIIVPCWQHRSYAVILRASDRKPTGRTRPPHRLRNTASICARQRVLKDSGCYASLNLPISFVY